MEKTDLLIIGAGPAGLAAAIEARKNGVTGILIAERDREMGGILNQCIHPGFGLGIFKRELTGPEFAGELEKELKELGIKVSLETMVLTIAQKDGEYEADLLIPSVGIRKIRVKSIILTMGCRERTRGAIDIPGTRPSGVMTAGQAQRFINIEGKMIGKKAVILGSGDIGLIMARRLTLEGAKVECVAEIMPWSGGLRRNIVQCLDDFGIPLKLSTTVTEVKGKRRVTSVVLSKVDEKGVPIKGTEEEIECDTLLLSVGLIPENELSKDLGVEISKVTGGPVVNQVLETSCKGVFAAGNVLHVHDLADNVVMEASRAGKSAAEYIRGIKDKKETSEIEVICSKELGYILPQKLKIKNGEPLGKTDFYFRVRRTMEDRYIRISQGDNVILRRLKVLMTPGEMEKITPDIGVLEPGTPVTVEVE